MARLRPPAVLDRIGLRISELRRSLGLTQEELAEQLGVGTKYVQRIEAGLENLTVTSLVGIANALDAPLAALFESPAAKRRTVGRPRGS